jgi:cytochrome c-type biogenesis protein CcmE
MKVSKKGLTLAILIAIVGILFLAWFTFVETASEVVTVSKLLNSQVSDRQKIRLGARVGAEKIDYTVVPQPLVLFSVHDIGDESKLIKIRFQGIMPDTLKEGRDVIVEGRFRDGEFVADTLLTQCPSKYQPPTPKEGELE